MVHECYDCLQLCSCGGDDAVVLFCTHCDADLDDGTDWWEPEEDDE